MKPSDIRIRCSSLGYVMTEPKEKSPYEKWDETKAALGQAKAAYAEMKNKDTATAKKKLESIMKMEAALPDLEARKDEPHLSETCKGHLADIMVRAKYNRQTEVATKYTNKGLMVEEDSITLYSRLTKKFYRKNEEQLTNEWISGTPDLYEGSDVHGAAVVHDVKSSWDIFTFFRNHEGKLNQQYFWQLQGYMDLTGAQRSNLAYCLINTPEQLIIEEKRRLFFKMGVISEDNPDYIEACDALDRNMVYDDIPLAERCIIIPIERDEDAIARIHARVEACRNYMASKYASLFVNTLIAQHDPEVGATIIGRG